jgi:hypothetical protein
LFSFYFFRSGEKIYFKRKQSCGQFFDAGNCLEELTAQERTWIMKKNLSLKKGKEEGEDEQD